MKYNEVNFDGDVTFRYRSTESLLGYLELENSEIYFCPFNEEDDVCEGTLNIYWQADEILWDNFFSHYILVLGYTYLNFLMTDENERKNTTKIEWRVDTNIYKFERAIRDFLDTNTVKSVKLMAMKNNHKVQSDEMKWYLRIIHNCAFIIIIKYFVSDLTYIDHSKEYNLDNNELFDDAERNFSALNSILDNVTAEFTDNSGIDEYCRWFLYEFPLHYYNILSEMTFPKWYIASFCKTCTDGRNWAQYGDNHRGVCLVFKTHSTTNGKCLKLKVCNEYCSTRGKIFNYHIEPLKTVNYIDSFQEFNFFDMIGTMPHAISTTWMKDRNGNISSFYKGKRTFETDEWRKKYWMFFESIITSKGSDWTGLAEERIVLEDNMLIKYDTVETRKINYDFNDLKGIIFGYKTSEENKQKIREIIVQKCKNCDRTDFQFYKADINKENGRIIIVKEI